MQTAKRAWTVASVDWKGLTKDFQELVQAQQRIRSWSGMTLAQFRKDRGFLENDLVVEGEAWWPGNLRRWAKAYHEKERAQIDAAQDTEIKPYADELLDFLNSNAPPETPVPTKPVAALSVGQERHLKRLVALTQKVTPAQLRYHGFLIQNPDRVPEEGLHALFEGINYLLALFKQKDMLPLLQKTLTGFEIEAKKEVEESRLQATYYPSTKYIYVPAAKITTRAGVWTKSKLAEIFIHEVGHHIHENLLAPQAKAEWDKGWGGFESKKDIPPEKLQALGIPSEYGQTDFKEDFAETFLYFMLAPEKLSATAKFRMQRSLWLSGWYDKPIMRVASRWLNSQRLGAGKKMFGGPSGT